MSVHSQNQTAGVGASGAASAAPSAQQTSFLNLGAFGISRDAPSMTLAKARTALEEAIKTIALAGSVELLTAPIDNTKLTRLQLSGVSIVMRPVDQNQKVAAHHTLVLEASGPALDDLPVNLNGTTVNMPRYTEAVYDRVYAETVDAAIRDSLPGYKTYSVSAEIVPKSFNWDDKDAVRALAINAICAVSEELNHRHGSGEINLANVVRDANLKVTVAYNCPDMVSAVGLPVRADLQMKLVAEATDRGDTTTVNNQRRTETLANIGGFIDAVWSPAQQPMVYGQVAPNKQKYIARLTLTRAEALQVMTPGMQLLVLASCLQLAENGAWWSYFRPRPAGQLGGQTDKRDVGALNIEANIYNEEGNFAAPLGTKTQNFDDQELGRFLSQAFAPELAVAVDVSTCSDDTWYNEILAYAASGNAEAINALIDAANTLTNGAFKEFWKGGDVVVQNEDIVLLGHYTQDGVKHDVRDIDYTALMNLVGRTNPLMGAAFTDTYLRTEQPLPARLIARRNIIQELVPGVTWTGTARRVTLMSPFMQAFLQGIAKCGLSLRMVNPGANGEFHSQRGTGDYLRAAAFNPAASGVFNTASGYAGSQQSYSRPFAGGRQW